MDAKLNSSETAADLFGTGGDSYFGNRAGKNRRAARRPSSRCRVLWATHVVVYALVSGFGLRVKAVDPWMVVTVDAGRDLGQHSSLTELTNGEPAISYYDVDEGDLKYAWHDEGEWHSTIIDTAGDVGQYTGLGIKSGDPVISYYDASNGALKYAWRSAGAWHTTTIDDDGDVGQYSSLVVLRSGMPAISYYDATHKDLKCARAYSGGGGEIAGWHIEVVDSLDAVGRHTSIAELGSGYPAISYAYSDRWMLDSDLKYAEFDGAEWDTTTVATSDMAGYYTSLKILPSGQPAISYGTYVPEFGMRLHCAWRDDSSDWVGEHNSLSILPSGRPAIAYYDAASRALKCAWFDGSEWHTRTVDNQNEVGEYANLAIVQGQMAITYYDASGRLKYAHIPELPYHGHSLFTTETVADEDEYGSTSLVFLGSGKPAMSYYAHASLHYAKYDGRSWHTLTIDADGNVGAYNSLAVLPTGHPAVAYWDRTNGDLKYAWHNGRLWLKTVVDADDWVGQHCSLAIQDTGEPAIAYHDSTNQALKYAWMEDGAWHTSTVREGVHLSDPCSLAMLPSSVPAIAYVSDGNLHFTWRTPRGWDVITIDTHAREPSLAIVGGIPMISYAVNAVNYSALRYAWHDDIAGWMVGVVERDDSASFYGSSLISLPSGHPIVGYKVYSEGDYRMRISWSDGTAWDRRGIIAETTVPSLAISPTGQPAYSYSTRFRLKYGAAPMEWHFSIPDAGADVGEFASLDILPSGEPAISYYDRTNGNLKYARREEGEWIIDVFDDDLADVGQYTSLECTPARPHVSYYDATNGDLMLAAEIPGGMLYQIVDSEGDVGMFSSLTRLPDGLGISYYDATRGDLLYATRLDSNPFDWTIDVVDSDGDFGQWTSSASLVSGEPAVVYVSEWNETLRYAWRDGLTWRRETVAEWSVVGGTSLAVFPSGQPAVTFSRGPADYEGELRYAWHDGQGWHTQVVDSLERDLTVGHHSLSILPSGQPAIGYRTADGLLAYATLVGHSWETMVVDESALDVAYPSLAVVPSGAPAIAYYDETRGELRYAQRIATYDYDGNGEYDLVDYGYFPDCMSGPVGSILGTTCLVAFDGDGNGHVDLRDFAGFQEAFGD